MYAGRSSPDSCSEATILAVFSEHARAAILTEHRDFLVTSNLATTEEPDITKCQGTGKFTSL